MLISTLHGFFMYNLHTHSPWTPWNAVGFYAVVCTSWIRKCGVMKLSDGDHPHTHAKSVCIHMYNTHKRGRKFEGPVLCIQKTIPFLHITGGKWILNILGDGIGIFFLI